MCSCTKKKLKTLFLIFCVVLILHIFGVFVHPFEKDFYTDFHYPYDGEIEEFVQQLKQNQTPSLSPINSYNFKLNFYNVNAKCKDVENLRLIYIIKSAPEHFNRRIGIRNSWGYEHRFSDVEIRTVFLVGERNDSQLQMALKNESLKYGDMIQGNFKDSYYNNTFKTMLGMEWAVKYCKNSKFYMFVDDDFYVSTKNVLRFIRYPQNYPKYLKEAPTNLLGRNLHQFEQDDNRLYAGYVFKSSPLRHYPSKWYVSLEEYPYHMWPPYVTAGAYILSREALLDMYYASFYTKHFRFDDIYLGLLAYKVKIEPIHSDEFYFIKKPYNKVIYKYTVASHGYDNPEELLRVWTEQRSLGNA